MLDKKEYNYKYEDERIIHAAESDVVFSGDMVISKVVVNAIRYNYDSPANGPDQTVYYETTDDNTTVKFSTDGHYVTSHSKADSFGRKVFDELQLGTNSLSRQFVYHAGVVSGTHQAHKKVKSSPTTQLVSQIVLSNGTTLSYGYDAEDRITSSIVNRPQMKTPISGKHCIFTGSGLFFCCKTLLDRL